jgi:hypothetical protein
MHSRRRVVALAAVLGVGLTSCGTDQRHAPFASATCRTSPCAVGAILGGRAPGGETDSGPSAEDSGLATPDIVCHTDPNSLIQLCTGSPACPGLFIDPVAFASCGFRGAGVDVECVCNGNTLCPVAVQTSCTYAASQLSLKTYDQICAPALAGGCADVNNLPRGTGGTAGSSGAGGGP